VLAALYWRRATTAGVFAGVVTGWAAAAFFYFQPALKPFGMHEGILGLLIHVPVLVLVSLATKPQDARHQAAYFGERAS
jgi:SSS family solute:Na+ symporter